MNGLRVLLALVAAVVCFSGLNANPAWEKIEAHLKESVPSADYEANLQELLKLADEKIHRITILPSGQAHILKALRTLHTQIVKEDCSYDTYRESDKLIEGFQFIDELTNAERLILVFDGIKKQLKEVCQKFTERKFAEIIDGKQKENLENIFALAMRRAFEAKGITGEQDLKSPEVVNQIDSNDIKFDKVFFERVLETLDPENPHDSAVAKITQPCEEVSTALANPHFVYYEYVVRRDIHRPEGSPEFLVQLRQFQLCNAITNHQEYFLQLLDKTAGIPSTSDEDLDIPLYDEWRYQ